VATTAEHNSTAAIGDSIISSTANLIIATGAGSIERLEFQTLVSYICFNLLQGGNIVVNSTSTDILN
jgi:hypothetical protein